MDWLPNRTSVSTTVTCPPKAAANIKKEAVRPAARNQVTRGTGRAARSAGRRRPSQPITAEGSLAIPRFCPGQWGIRRPEIQAAGLRQLIVYGRDLSVEPAIFDITESAGVMFLNVAPPPPK